MAEILAYLPHFEWLAGKTPIRTATVLFQGLRRVIHPDDAPLIRVQGCDREPDSPLFTYSLADRR